MDSKAEHQILQNQSEIMRMLGRLEEGQLRQNGTIATHQLWIDSHPNKCPFEGRRAKTWAIATGSAGIAAGIVKLLDYITKVVKS